MTEPINWDEQPTFVTWAYECALVVWASRAWIIRMVILAALVGGAIAGVRYAAQRTVEVSVRIWVVAAADELVTARAVSGELARAAGLVSGERVIVRPNGKERREIVLLTQDAPGGVSRINRLADLLIEETNGPSLQEWERAERERRDWERAELERRARATRIATREAPLPLFITSERPPARVRITDRAVGAKRPLTHPAYLIVLAAIVATSVAGAFVAIIIEAFRREHRRQQRAALGRTTA